MAVRDADYATMTWFPESPALDRWLALYEDASPAATAASRTPAGG